MRRNRALQQLSPIHAIALRLDALGADRELIAACLRIAPEAVPPLLEVAAAKFARANDNPGATATPEHGSDSGSSRSSAVTPEEATGAPLERKGVG